MLSVHGVQLADCAEVDPRQLVDAVVACEPRQKDRESMSDATSMAYTFPQQITIGSERTAPQVSLGARTDSSSSAGCTTSLCKQEAETDTVVSSLAGVSRGSRLRDPVSTCMTHRVWIESGSEMWANVLRLLNGSRRPSSDELELMLTSTSDAFDASLQSMITNDTGF